MPRSAAKSESPDDFRELPRARGRLASREPGNRTLFRVFAVGIHPEPFAEVGAAAFPARQRVRGALRHVRDPHFVEESIGAGFQCYGEMGGLISLVFHNIICLSENAVLGLFS